MNSNKHYIPLALVLAATSALSSAEESATQLTNVVVSAAGYEQKLVEAPASISVISSAELRSRPYATLLDAVRELEGVDIGETRDKTGQGTISMRGMGSDYTLILIDGKRQNNHGNIYPNNFGGNQFNNIPPLDAIERIEVIRGPASTLYGADALGGVINIITKKVSNEWHGSATLGTTVQEQSEYGEDSTLDINLMGPIIKDVLGLKLRGSYYDREASTPLYDPAIDPNGNTHDRSLGFGGGGKTVDNTNNNLGLSLDWKISNQQTLSFDIDSYRQKYDNKPVDGLVPLGTVDSIASIWKTGNVCIGGVGTKQAACVASGGTWTKRATPQAGYAANQEFTRDTWSLTHNGTWDFGNSFISFEHVSTKNNGRTLPFSTGERKQLLEMIDGTGIYVGKTLDERKALAETSFLPRPKREMESEQYVLDAKLDMPFELAGQHTAVLGGQVTRGKLHDGVFGLEEGAAGQAQQHNMWSVFAEDTWYVWTPFSVTTGVRYDNHEVFGDHISPRLYGVYNLTSDWTIKGGISTGFKTPNTTDLYDGVTGFGGQGTSPMFGNPNLKPEISTSAEAAVYWQHPTQNHGVNLTVFKNTFKDKISSQPCGPTTSYECASTGEYADLGYSTSTRTANIDEVVLEGIEMAGRYQIMDSVGVRANYTYTDSEQKSGKDAGRPYSSSAKHMANATLDWQTTERFNLFLTLEARDKRYRSWDTATDAALYYKEYEIFHLGFSYKISKNIALNGRVNNLFDHDFTTYDTRFDACDTAASNCIIYNATGTSGGVATGDGWKPVYTDDYNNKDKRRNYWMSLNVAF